MVRSTVQLLRLDECGKVRRRTFWTLSAPRSSQRTARESWSRASAPHAHTALCSSRHLIQLGRVDTVEAIGGAVQLEGVAVFDEEIGRVARTNRCGSDVST
jgi:hypothetical protein